MIRPRSALERHGSTVMLGLALGSVYLLGRAACAPVQADDRREVRQLAELALHLAVVAAHEGALANERETALVWQTAETRGSTTAARLRFLRDHSPRALGLAPCTSGGNCRWTPDLLRAPDQPPRSIDAAWWRAARADAWGRVQRYALGLVYGVETWRPCSVPPWTWGYSGDLDGALRRGLMPLGCAGVDQDGFALARVVLPARVASGGSL